MKVLLLGSGAREHALAWKLAQSPALTELHAAPGSPGIAAHAACHPVRAEDAEAVVALATELEADLVVVGPEAPLVAGVVDALADVGISAFGPRAAAARIEGSKAFAKDVMEAAGVPTARALDEPRAPCVVKADGLASGKGVFVCRTDEELEAALVDVRRFGGDVVVEELLEGREVSVFAICDGSRALPFGAAQDYKRAGDGDTGPNTGGMGAYAPVPWVGDLDALVAAIHQPVVDELARRGTPFVGCLFAGLMVGDDGPRVLEFNARFGDPETQVLLPLADGDLLPLLAAAAAGGATAAAPVRASAGAAVTVVLAGRDYPARSDHDGDPISGLDRVDGAFVFHGGTALAPGGETVVTHGGRILSVTATGPTVASARSDAYAAVDMIAFDGSWHRTDIAAGVDG